MSEVNIPNALPWKSVSRGPEWTIVNQENKYTQV